MSDEPKKCERCNEKGRMPAQWSGSGYGVGSYTEQRLCYDCNEVDKKMERELSDSKYAIERQLEAALKSRNAAKSDEQRGVWHSIVIGLVDALQGITLAQLRRKLL